VDAADILRLSMLVPNERDYSPWTAEEMNLLAAETADLLAGDGFDEPTNPLADVGTFREHLAASERGFENTTGILREHRAKFDVALAKVADVGPDERDRL
jgi:hypothetical protein